jgi:hypothetical protein
MAVRQENQNKLNMTKSIVAIAALGITASSLLYSCKKDTTTTPETTTQTSVKRMGRSGGFNTLRLFSGKMRMYDKSIKDCINTEENCHPEDIVITAPSQYVLDQAIAQGSYGVSNLFTNNETAISLIPDWNTDWFADVKTAILSGQYTFVKASGTSIYLLGKAGTVSTENFDYAISYKVQ